MKKINKFDFEDDWVIENSFNKSKRLGSMADDIDEVALEEDLLESQSAWERGFELGAAQASEEMLERKDDED
jgi:hypothetical protein